MALLVPQTLAFTPIDYHEASYYGRSGLSHQLLTGQIEDRHCGGLSIVGNTYKTYQKRLSSPLVEHTQWYNNNP
jgi:hypothetical protein